MNKKRFYNVIVCFVMAFFMFFAAGCFENPDRDHVHNPGTNQNQGNTDGGDNQNKGDDTNNNQNNNDNDDNNNNNDNNDNNDEETPTTINIVGFGDSIAAGYAVEGSDMYTSYTAFDNGEASINDMCFTNIIASQFESSYDEVRVKSYAKSGDETGDLIAKFNNTTLYADLAEDVENADIITLCIGANNVLSVALNNMANYFSGSISIDEIETLLQQGVANFKNDYSNTIIPYLTQGAATVYVMTIYDPYYYFDFDDMYFETEVMMGVNVKNEFKQSFNSLKNLAISYMDEVNSYIKSYNYQGKSVVVVDVNSSMKTLTKSQYSEYINADSTQIQFTTMDLVLMAMSEDISTFANNQYFDPHPTALGQRYIANLFLRAMEMDEVALSWFIIIELLYNFKICQQY